MIVLLGGLAIVLGALYVMQRRLIYFPSRLSRAEFTATVSGTFGAGASLLEPFDAVVFEPAASGAGTAILFHGNAGLGLERAYLAPIVTRRGIRLLLAEYPGYAARPGAPTEQALVDDANALYARVAAAYPGMPILLVGESLGSGVAVQVAAAQALRPPARLVLLTPFMSLAATAARVYPFLPVRYLLRDRFDSAGALPRYGGDVAILVAGNDQVVGAEQGRALAQIARARGATQLVELASAGHNSWSVLVTDEQWTELLGAAPLRDP